ncbi:hypothetical protein ACD578_05500 [Microvirga sp. RSM25]|uniref:hypothetical protein n=1 Tax=Microvirga sp. RSM25 TaxID=3273802 RepID=UPI00384E9019
MKADDPIPRAANPEPAQHDKVTRFALGFVALLGVTVLAVVAEYLLTLGWTPQDINKRPLELQAFRF